MNPLFDYGLFCCHKSPGYLWFRIVGWGIHMRRLRDHPPLFSEREGRVRYVDLLGWRFRWLS